MLAIAIGVLAWFPAGGVLAQQSRGAPIGGDPTENSTDPVLSTAREWGGHSVGVFTCDEWRQYLDRMYTIADKRHRGYIDANDFETVKRISPVFAKASFDYFDGDGKGRVTRKEFVAAPSIFFVRYDKKNTCRVTLEDIRQAMAPAAPAASSGLSRRGGGFGGHRM